MIRAHAIWVAIVPSADTEATALLLAEEVDWVTRFTTAEEKTEIQTGCAMCEHMS